MVIIWNSEKESLYDFEKIKEITKKRILSLEESVSKNRGKPILIHRRFYNGFISAGELGGFKEERDYFEKGFISGNLQNGSFEDPSFKSLFYLLDVSEKWDSDSFLYYTMGGDFFIPVKNKTTSFNNSLFEKIENPQDGFLGIRKHEFAHRDNSFEKEDFPKLSLFGIFIGKKEIENAPSFYGKDFYFLNFPFKGTKNIFK